MTKLTDYFFKCLMYLIHVYDYEFCVELAFMEKMSGNGKTEFMEFLRFNCDYNYSPYKNTIIGKIIDNE